MSETLLLAILSISELALITTGLAVFLFLRNRRIARERDEAETNNLNEPIDKAHAEIKFSDYLQQNMEQTRQKLTELPEEQARVLQKRLDYLQTELNAQGKVDDADAFWQQLIGGFDSLVPDPGPQAAALEKSAQEFDTDVNETGSTTLDELDDIDIQTSIDNIPTLEDNFSNTGGVKKDPSLTIESANQDLERLRKIISRQHNTMDELKKSLQGKDADLENNQEVSKKLEEIEVAQAQLNMCVETLEKENGRLNELIKGYEESPQQEQLIIAQQELEEANERISTLEKENSQQAERITELESEIAELEKALQQRSEELARVQNQEANLSQTDDNVEHSQDSLMKEIETLTQLITQKSEELSKLQSGTTDEFDFDSELAAMGTDESSAAKG
jgi:predicted nuclease with TOPRIM domain